MRLALVSLIALAGAASAYAQSTDQTSPASPPAPPSAAPTSAPPPVSPAPEGAAPTSPPAASAPPATPGASPEAAQAPPTNAAPPTTAPPTPAVEEAPPPSPPPPPPPPTDPTAIELLSVLQHICIPAANGGNLPQLAKAAGFRKNSDSNWMIKTRDYSIVVEDPGSNPNQCHVDVTHPLDLESPGRPIIIALNDWAGIENGWSLYRNDKNVQGGTQFTTRSWQHTTDTKDESLVFTTMRKADGTPLKGGVDTSEMIYGVEKVSS